jgi:hypothetical protein
MLDVHKNEKNANNDVHLFNRKMRLSPYNRGTIDCTITNY